MAKVCLWPGMFMSGCQLLPVQVLGGWPGTSVAYHLKTFSDECGKPAKNKDCGILHVLVMRRDREIKNKRIKGTKERHTYGRWSSSSRIADGAREFINTVPASQPAKEKK